MIYQLLFIGQKTNKPATTRKDQKAIYRSGVALD